MSWSKIYVEGRWLCSFKSYRVSDIEFSDRRVMANSLDQDQLAWSWIVKESSDQDLCCLPFHLYLLDPSGVPILEFTCIKIQKVKTTLHRSVLCIYKNNNLSAQMTTFSMVSSPFNLNILHRMGQVMWKCVLCHMRTSIRAVWSAPLLFVA